MSFLSCTPLEFGSQPEAVCASTADCGAGKRCVEGLCQKLAFEECDGVDNDLDGETDEGLLNACMRCGPTPTEICNGIDDDCDGLVDEGFPNVGEQCSFERDGETIIGLQTCSLNGGGVVCKDTAGISREVCDGLDNDMDGQIDEEINEEERACPVGSCRRVALFWCENGIELNTCQGEEGAEGTEIPDLCDGIDNDCDGQFDENHVEEATECENDDEDMLCALVGSIQCIDGQEIDSCQTLKTMRGEACDGEDNDCDGLIDELPGMAYDSSVENVDRIGEPCNEGICRAHYRYLCLDGTPLVYCTDNDTYRPDQPDRFDPVIANIKHDWCGGGDEDCDGFTDEDSRPHFTECLDDPNRIGVYVCDQFSTPSDTEEDTEVFFSVGCGEEEPHTEICNGVDDDLDGIVDNNNGVCTCPYGWEDEPDDLALDTNCDGLDGYLKGSIFVSALHGDDEQGQGTALAPFKSVKRALAYREQIAEKYENKEHVLDIYLATGSYLWLPTLVQELPIRIFGGYQVLRLSNGQLQWSRPSFAESVGESVLSTTEVGPAFKLMNSKSKLTLQRIKIIVDDLGSSTLTLHNIGLMMTECNTAHLSHVEIVVGSAKNGANGVSGNNNFTTEIGGIGQRYDAELNGQGGVNLSCCQENSCSGGAGGLFGQEGESGYKTGQLQIGLGGDPSFDVENIASIRENLSGLPGEDGSQGRLGESAQNIYGFFSAESYRWFEAEDSAIIPAQGEAGGGGGGGSGSPSSFSIPRAGGGGGAGGCGGSPGSNAKPGGWSVGIIFSDRCHVNLEHVIIQTGTAGKGGIGGKGQPGQNGYLGGLGSIPFSDGYSGDGGSGGKGGCGGHGSSGNGGHSVGLVHLGSTQPVNLSTVSYQLASPGEAGDIVRSEDIAECSEGNRGIDGRAIEALCCPRLDEVEQRFTNCAPCVP